MALERAARARKAVLEYLDAQAENLLACTHELVATPSPNPPGDERAVVAVIQARMEGLGLGRGELLARAPERPNLVCRIPGGAGEGPTLMFNGHTDTKPVGADVGHLWETDPFTPTVRDGRIYGLGTADMKGGVAAMIYAAAALAQAREVWGGELVLALTADEEAGSRFGAGYLASHSLVQADVGLVAEPCGISRDWETLCLAARGTLGFRTRVYGDQIHSSLSDHLGAVNACQKMAWVLDRMRSELRIEVPPHPYYPQGATHNFGVTVAGGVYYGVVPGYAEFKSDVRLPPGSRASEAWAQIQRFVEDLRGEDPGLSVELVQELPDPAQPEAPYPELAAGHPLVGALQRGAQTVLGHIPPLGGFPAATDASQWHNKGGIPTIPAFGPGLLPVCHGPNEWVTVEAIRQAARLYALAALDFLAVGPRAGTRPDATPEEDA